jgi:hypothetical protein
VVFERQFTVRLLDFILRAVLGQSHNLVVVSHNTQKNVQFFYWKSVSTCLISCSSFWRNIESV